MSAQSYPDAKSVRGSSYLVWRRADTAVDATDFSRRAHISAVPSIDSTQVLIAYISSSISPGRRVTSEGRCVSYLMSQPIHQDLEGGNDPGRCYATCRFDLSSLIS
jgi:hypothetical protein